MPLNKTDSKIYTWRFLSTLWKVWELRMPFPRAGHKVRAPLGENRWVEVTRTQDKDPNGRPLFRVDYFDAF